jgi:hypothetical protein
MCSIYGKSLYLTLLHATQISRAIGANKYAKYVQLTIKHALILCKKLNDRTLTNANIRNSIKNISQVMKIPYGQAQKGINVILKYCFFICHPDDHVGLELDCPIDSKILGYIGYRNLKLIRINEKKYIEIQKIIERRITRRIDFDRQWDEERLNKYRISF